jgi:hypothetical protein
VSRNGTKGSAMTPGVETVLAAIRRWPEVQVDIDETHRSAGVRVGPRLIAHIDLQRGQVLVNAPGDTLAALQQVFSPARLKANGVAFDLDDRQSSTALAAIRCRAQVEKLAWQLRAASP